MVTREEYEEALILRHGEERQKRISAASVAVAGLGGLGSNIALLLARAGVGRLLLVDFDTVDITNIHRQQYDISDVGQPKTEAMKKNIMRVNPFVRLKTLNVHITEENSLEVFCGYPIVCEAFDGAEDKAMLVNSLMSSSGDTKIIAASGMAGMGAANEIRTRKISDRFYLCGDTKTDVSDCGFLTAPRVALCAAHQAMAAIRIIMGEEDENE